MKTKAKKQAPTETVLEPEDNKVSKVVMIPIAELYPNDWNPQVMSQEEFNALVQEIEQDGFDEPIIVCPKEKGGWTIIAGQHRHEACKVLGFKMIPCVVKTDWDMQVQKIKTVRRNLLRGSIDSARFTKLVNDLHEQYDLSLNQIRDLMGFTNEKEFFEQYKTEEAVKDEAITDLKNQSRQEMNAVQNLSFILNDLISQYGDTIPNGYVYFFYGTQWILSVSCDKVLEKRLTAMMEALQKDEVKIQEVLADAIDIALEKKLKGGKQ